ncbi:hypothetical protein CAPTEDRAFT_204618 [Capitella teleta]|uniref:SH3 domain-containing protein n=1 Tax=Capitella teleta TaxID=283909 RepID=R7ULQ0_CAPTE|nr:hypothetical protein CAPTEDRAFT_204618 [Capitella teleta]|eukprot:ELU07013.1 hypothetical protein CAPTEDRAFT_204618 [Capitella teleta]
METGHRWAAHKKEDWVLGFDQKIGKDRDAHLEKLRNLGDHLHNMDVLKREERVLVVGQRPNQEKMKMKKLSTEDYGSCPTLTNTPSEHDNRYCYTSSPGTKIVKGLHNYESGDDEELSFNKGDFMEIISE